MKYIDNNYSGNLKWLSDHTFYVSKAGSQAYGLETPESDVDVRGICVPPREYYLGFLQNFEQAIWSEPDDTTIFGINKFFKLAADANPNVIELLFVDEEDVIESNEMGEVLRHYRDSFLSKKAKFTFSGYAHSQLKRIKTHRRWLLEPPEKKPSRDDYGITQQSLLDANIRGALDALDKEGYELSSEVMEVFKKERKYASAMHEYHLYEGWKKNRNPVRAALEAEFGYDCYVEETEFLTESGWKTYDEISDDERLATVYAGDAKYKSFGTVEYQEPYERFDGTINGNIYHLFGNHLSVETTPNHKMLVRKVERRSGKESDWEFCEASALPDTFEVLRAPTPRTHAFNQKEVFKDAVLANISMMRLMGWYLSDGCAVYRDGKLKEIRISQSKKGTMLASMKKFHNKYPTLSRIYTYDRGKNNPETILVVTGAAARFVEKNCGSKKEKRIPRWSMTLTKRMMSALLDGLMAGDGTVRPSGSEIYYSTLPGLADDVQELAMMCGYETSLYGPYERITQYGYSPLYYVHVSRDKGQWKKCTRGKNVEKRPAIEKRIVCFSVPNSTLITRLNGHISIHGNCKHASHLVRLLRMGKEILEGRGVIVKRKEDGDELRKIKLGDWSFEQLIEYSEQADSELNDLYEKSELRKSPDRVFLDELLVYLVEESRYGNSRYLQPTIKETTLALENKSV